MRDSEAVSLRSGGVDRRHIRQSKPQIAKKSRWLCGDGSGNQIGMGAQEVLPALPEVLVAWIACREVGEVH